MSSRDVAWSRDWRARASGTPVSSRRWKKCRGTCSCRRRCVAKGDYSQEVMGKARFVDLIGAHGWG